MTHSSILRPLAAVALAGAIAAAFAVAATFMRTSEAATIPAAAAEEARIVCSNFQGLDHFKVESAGTTEATATDGPLQRYRVTAHCLSQHTITGEIAISSTTAREGQKL